MPKKTRKAKVRASQRAMSSGYAAPSPRTVEPTDQDFATPVAAQAVATQTMPRPSSAAARSATPIVYDSGYVFRDLRRIALLAIFCFGLMFVLWFLIEVQHVAIIPGL